MSKQELVLSDAAVSDILEQADWYEHQSGLRLAERWERAVGNSLLKLVKTPSIGAPCQFKAKELCSVRRIPVPGFPKHLIFYTKDADNLLILRVLHGARDLETLL